MWEGFAKAVVRLELPTGPAVLEPRVPGAVGSFPLGSPAYIITACNPWGMPIDERQNAARHRAFGIALSGADFVPSIGSTPDGSMPEPGYALLDATLEEAMEIAVRVGQKAIYRWADDSLEILGVEEPVILRLGWSLRPVDPG